MACENGHIEIAKWLWAICPDLDQSAMLQNDNHYAFHLACQNGHLKMVEWLFDLYETDERLRIYKKHDNNGLLWLN